MSNPSRPAADVAHDLGPWEPPEAPLSPRQKAWLALLELAPDLKGLSAPHFPGHLPPARLNNGLFLALCACLIDPRTRGILRALLLDLIDDDVRKLILSYLTEETK